MNKTIRWKSSKHLLLSTGHRCSLLSLEEGKERPRDFKTEAVSALSPDGTLVVSLDLDKVVRVRWMIQREWRAGNVLFSCQQLSPSAVLGFAWSPDGTLLAVQQADGSTHTYQLQPGRNRRPGQRLAVYHSDIPPFGTCAMAFAPRGKRIASACSAGAAIWEAQSGIRLCCLGKGQVRSIAWSPNGRYLAIGDTDSTIGIYQAGRRQQQQVWEWTGHTAAVCAIAWSPDGNRMASGDQDGTILTWETRGDIGSWGLCEAEVMLLRAGVCTLTWSPDSEKLASVDDQDQLEIFVVGQEGAGVLSAEHTASLPRF